MAGIIGEAFVRVRPEMRSFRGDVERNARTASRGLGKIIGAGLGVGIGFGIERELRKSVDAAKDAQVVQARLEQAVRSQGIAWSENADHIEEATNALAKLSSFDDEELKDSFVGLLRRTGDVNKALKLNALVADVARGANLPLATVAKAIGRAYDGQTAGLNRLGISVKKGVTGFQALTQVQRKYAGSAQAYANTAEGAQARLNKTLDDSREIIGGALLPVITDLSTKFADYLDTLNESGELQEKVNSTVEDGRQIIHGLAEGFGIARSALAPFVDLVGGLDNAIQLALGAKLLTTAGKAVVAMRGIGTAFGITTGQVVADSAVMGKAIDVATRPRVVSVTFAGAGGRTGPPILPVPTGKGGKGGGGKFPKIPFVIGWNPETAVAAAVIVSAGAAFRPGAYKPSKYPHVASMLARVGRGGTLTPDEVAILSKYGGKPISELTASQLGEIERALARATRPSPGLVRRPEEGAGGPGPPGTRGGRRRTGDTGKTRGITPLQQLRLDLAAAQREGNLPESQRIQRKIVGIFKWRLDHTKLRGQAYARFWQDYSDALDTLDSFNDQAASDAAQRTSDRQTKRQQRADAVQAKQDKADTKLLHRLQRGRRPVNQAIARALGTEGTKDDVITAKALVDRIDKDIAIVKANVKNVDTRTQALDSLYDDRDAAWQGYQDAKTAHSAHLKQIAADAQTKRTSDLDTILQIAQLTEDPAAIGRALDAVIANDRKNLAKARKAGVGVLDAILKLRTDLKAKRDLLKGGAAGTTGTTAYDLLTASIGQFGGGNLINANQPFAGPQGFVAPLTPFLRRVPGVSYPGSPPGTGTTGGPTPAERSIDRLIAALDRNTGAKNADTASTATAPKIDPRRIRHGLSGDGRYYEAARARNNVETRGGV